MSRNESLQFVNVAHFLDHFFLLIFPTAALAIAPAWGMDYSDVLMFGTPLYAMFAFGTLPAGWLGDRIDRMKLMVLFFLGCGASSLWIAFSTGPVAMLIGLGFLGLFTAIYHPVGLALVTEIGVRTGRALAINGVFGNLGLAGSAVTTGVLAQFVGWQSAFALPGLVSIAIGIVLYLRYRSGFESAVTRSPAARRIAVTPDRRTQYVVFGVICVAALFGGVIFNAVTISLPKFFDERLVAAAGDLTWIGASTGMVFAIAAFAQLPVGELLDRIGAKPVLLCLVSGQILLLLALSQAAGWTALALALLLVTLVFAEIPISTWLLGHYIQSALRSRAVSVEYMLSLGMGSATVPLISVMLGAGYGFDVQLLILAASASFVLTAALFLPTGLTHLPEARLPEGG